MKITCTLLILILLVGCKTDFRDKVSNSLDGNCQKKCDSCSTVIRLDELTDFKWDRFYYFAAGITLEDIDETLGFRYPYWRDLSESLIFIRNDTVIYHEEYPIPDLDKQQKEVFMFEIDAGPYTPLSAKFLVKCETENNCKYFTLTPVVSQ